VLQKPKVVHFQFIADRIRIKLASWKASLLSIVGRIQLVKSVIHSMILHTILIYSWPSSLIKDIERCLRNFIWSGDLEKRKLVTVAWHKCCLPYSEGGLGMRSISVLNDASNLKMCWDLINSDDQWAKLLKQRVIRGNRCIRHHISSSLWSSFKYKFADFQENTIWMLGNGNDIGFWTDKWCDEPLVETLQIPDNIHTHLISKVSHFIKDNNWFIPQEIQNMFPTLLNIVQRVIIPYGEKRDTRIWSPEDNGILNLKTAYAHCSPASNNIFWGKLIWNISNPPTKSLLFWRFIHNKLPTDENLMRRGMFMPSCCSLCYKKEENSHHLIFDCAYASNIWRWLASSIFYNHHISSIQDIWQILDVQRSPQCKIVVLSAVINSINAIWFARNQKRFNNTNIHWRSSIARIISEVSLSGNSTKKSSHSSMTDFSILKNFNVTIHPPNAPKIKEVFWTPPSQRLDQM